MYWLIHRHARLWILFFNGPNHGKWNISKCNIMSISRIKNDAVAYHSLWWCSFVYRADSFTYFGIDISSDLLGISTLSCCNEGIQVSEGISIVVTVKLKNFHTDLGLPAVRRRYYSGQGSTHCLQYQGPGDGSTPSCLVLLKRL